MPLLDDDRLVFRFPEIGTVSAFEIDFQRTLRIPDTDRDYPLPPGFGRFPLEHVEDHPALPEHTRRRGGVLGLSGGIDSTTVAYLAVEALGPDAVHGLVMPSVANSEENMSDAEWVAQEWFADDDGPTSTVEHTDSPAL